MGITFGDYLIDSGYYEPEEESMPMPGRDDWMEAEYREMKRAEDEQIEKDRAMKAERCPTCNMTDAGYSVYIEGWCRDPWHGDDHLRAASVREG